MKSLVVAAVLLAGSSAHAGGYIGLGIGDGQGVSGDVPLHANGRTERLIGGFSFGKLAVEGSVARAPLYQDGGRDYTATQLAVLGKYSLPLSDGFEAYGRLGLQRLSLDGGDPNANADGTGAIGGGGIEYRSKLPVSFWLDYTLSNASVNGPSFHDLSVTTRQWMIGASLGI